MRQTTCHLNSALNFKLLVYIIYIQKRACRRSFAERRLGLVRQASARCIGGTELYWVTAAASGLREGCRNNKVVGSKVRELCVQRRSRRSPRAWMRYAPVLSTVDTVCSVHDV